MNQQGIVIETQRAVVIGEEFDFWGHPDNLLSVGNYVVLWFVAPNRIYGVARVTRVWNRASGIVYKAERIL